MLAVMLKNWFGDAAWRETVVKSTAAAALIVAAVVTANLLWR